MTVFVVLCLFLLIYGAVVGATAYYWGRVNALKERIKTETTKEVVTVLCTSKTRPTEPYLWMNIYETDTHESYIYTGSAWWKLQQRKGDKRG